MLLCGKNVLDVVSIVNLQLRERGEALQLWATQSSDILVSKYNYIPYWSIYLLLLSTSIALSASSTFR